jgi:hypothetical protein
MNTHVFKLLEELNNLSLLLLNLLLVGQAGQGRSHFHHLLTNKGSKYSVKKQGFGSALIYSRSR